MINNRACNPLRCFPVPGIAVLVFLLSAQPANASLSVGVDMQGATWNVSPPANQPENDATGIQLGFNLKIKFYQLYTGLDYMAGQYDFGSQVVPGVATISPDPKVNRTEWNAVVGYYVFRYLSFFVKYKSLDFDNAANYRLENPGVGTQLHYPLTSHWLLFANAATFTGNFSVGGGSKGDADITEYEYGIAYRPSLHSYVDIGIKSQSIDYNYDNDGTESHRVQGLNISYNYVF